MSTNQAIEQYRVGKVTRADIPTMLSRIRQALAGPVFQDPEKTQAAALLNVIILILSTITLITTPILTLLNPSGRLFDLGIIISVLIVAIGLQVLMRRGFVRLAGTMFCSLLTLMITGTLYVFGGLRNPIVTGYLLPVSIAALLLGGQAAVVFGALSIMASFGLYYLEVQDMLYPMSTEYYLFSDWISLTAVFALESLLLRHAVRSIARGQEQVRRHAGALAERTRQLEASQRVTFAASERTSPDELLGLVVNLIRDQFDLYHAQVYIVDDEQQAAVLRKSTGYAGRQLLQKQHRIPLDYPALVTKAIHSGERVLVTDVSKDADFMPNPLLPDTQSELVVPLKTGDRIIGVLDVQDRTPGRFTDSTAALFQTMADQIALLFENSALITRVSEQTESLSTLANQLRTAAAIAQRLGTILDPDLLMWQVVELMQTRFGLYHAHMYILDEAKGELVMQAGSGEVGRVLRERNHAISLDRRQSLVARAARTRQTVVVQDTALEPDFLPNPLLPHTRSEMSIPMLVGDRVLGVLDVQDDRPGRFTQTDVDTFGTLAGQISTALENARLFEEQQRAEEAARDSEARMRVILEASPVPTIVIRADDDVVLYANKHLTDLFGLALDGWLDHQMPDFYANPTDRQMIMNTLKQNGTLRQREVQLRKPNGLVFWALLSMEALTFDGQPAILAAIRDISERKRAEAERVRFTNQLRTAADLAEQINAILDPDEVLGEVVAQLQKRFELYHAHVYLLDERKNDLVMRAGSGEVGKKLRAQGHKIPLAREKSLVARAAREQKVVTVGDTSAEPGFMPNPLLPETRSEVAVPLITGDKTLGVLDVQDNRPHRFTQSDLAVFSTLAGQIATAVQNAALFEEVQQTANRLREVDRLKSEFLANMSHELRTPLNSIIGYTEIMLMGINGELDPETLQDVRAIYENGQHLLRLINDVLDLAKIEAGRLSLEMEQIDVRALIDEVSTIAAGLIANKPIDLVVEVDEGIPPIEADDTRLKQILNNLMSNAAKFTDRGTITLRASIDGEWLCFQVEDTGIGISETDLENLFERFHQVDGSSARRADGTGLGLAISRHLVQMHNGTIDIESQLGAGTSFSVRLPVQQDQAAVNAYVGQKE